MADQRAVNQNRPVSNEQFNEWLKHPVTMALFDFFQKQENTARTILGTSPWATHLRRGKMTAEAVALEQIYYSTLADEYNKLVSELAYDTLYPEVNNG